MLNVVGRYVKPDVEEKQSCERNRAGGYQLIPVTAELNVDLKIIY